MTTFASGKMLIYEFWVVDMLVFDFKFQDISALISKILYNYQLLDFVIDFVAIMIIIFFYNYYSFYVHLI